MLRPCASQMRGMSRQGKQASSATVVDMSIQTVLVRWSVTGFVVPIAILIVSFMAGGVFPWPYMAIVLWPAWFLNAAAFGREVSLFGFAILLLSLVLNVALYALIGTTLWCIKGQVRQIQS